MTTTELLNSVQFITDADGNKKAVIVDLPIWEEIAAALEKLDALESVKSPIERDWDTPKEDTAWAHLSELPAKNQQLLALLRTPPDDDKDDAWWDEFQQELRDNRLNFQREVNFD